MIKRFIVKKFRRTSEGYTLIETMIAVSLFIVIVMEGMGALLNAGLLSKKSQNMRSIIDNLSFVMQDMATNIRTGYNYHCFTTSPSTSIPTSPASDIANPAPANSATGASCWALAFESANGDSSNSNDQWVYYIQGGKIFKATAGPYVSGAGGNFVQLTPDEVNISSTSGFAVLGALPPSSGDTQQPLVTIRLAGTITLQNVMTPFSLQTTVSQASLDF